jgi:hypothetical protein
MAVGKLHQVKTGSAWKVCEAMQTEIRSSAVVAAVAVVAIVVEFAVPKRPLDGRLPGGR